MMSEIDLIYQQLLVDADSQEITVGEAFGFFFVDCMESGGVFSDAILSYHRSKYGELGGIAIDPERGILNVFSFFIPQDMSTSKIDDSDINSALNKMDDYLRNLVSNKIKNVDKSLDISDLNALIIDQIKKKKITRVTYHLAVLGITNKSNIEFAGKIDLPSDFIVWSIDDLRPFASENSRGEPIIVELDEAFPVLVSKINANLEVLVGVISGKTLADMYSKYGSRLLELNVRSFLEVKGSVNRGMRETLLKNPQDFMAFNNGITATATKVIYRKLKDGTSGVSVLEDLQIVNGGQTTATISYVQNIDEMDVQDVSLQIKLVIVNKKHRESYVPLISKYSNTQNKVTTVDFSSNHPFHLSFEKFSRETWTPTEIKGETASKWFYERMRGQYVYELNVENQKGNAAKFKLLYPSKMKFNKGELAKWINSWNQSPHLVSLGVEKNFKAFMNDLGSQNPCKDEMYFKRVLGMGILFRGVEDIVTQLGFGGYRANIVTYTVAKLSNATKMRLNFEQIWMEQSLPKVYKSEIEKIAKTVFKVLSNPQGTKNVTEWAKKEACWKNIRELPWVLDRKINPSLLESAQLEAILVSQAESVLSSVDQENLDYVVKFEANVWFGMAKWAKETGSLLPWQRSLAVGIGRLLDSRKNPSVKQCNQGRLAMEKALDLGFDSKLGAN